MGKKLHDCYENILLRFPDGKIKESNIKCLKKGVLLEEFHEHVVGVSYYYADYLENGNFSYGKENPNKNETDLTKVYMDVADGPDIAPGSVNNNSLQKVACNVELIFRNHKDRLIQEIHKAHQVVGCMAWLSNYEILDALASVEAMLLVQKEDFLRPDVGSQSGMPYELRKRYSKIVPLGWCSLDVGIGDTYSVQQLSAAGYPEAVRCVGIDRGQSQTKSPQVGLMHHKFLVFFEHGNPYAVWTGSFNASKNAERSFENAVIIYDEKIAQEYVKEVDLLLGISEPLDWAYKYVAPEYRDGT